VVVDLISMEDVAVGLLSGRIALVTGASAGLGAHFSRTLRNAGADVVITARRGDQLRQSITGTSSIALEGDLTSASHRQALADLVLDRFGRLDVLVNNAGASDDGLLEEQSLEDLTSVIDLNLVAMLDLCRLMAPLLFASSGATVINISSIYGVIGSRDPMIAYNASKGAVANLTRNLAAQWGPRDVRVNALAPGYFPSEMTGGLASRGLVERIEKRTLLGRVPTLDELDGPLLFLASSASSYVTGHTLVVDGGWTCT
jgi:hypothetical protein